MDLKYLCHFRIFHDVDCKILVFEVTKVFFRPCKNLGSYTSEGHICMKKCTKIVVTFWIHSSRQVGYMLENFQISYTFLINEIREILVHRIEFFFELQFKEFIG